MSVLYKKLLRAFTKKKLRTIIIVLSIALSISLYGGMIAIQDNIYDAVDATYDELHYEHAAFRTFGYAPRENFTSIASEVDNIQTWDVRVAYKTLVEVDGNDFNAVVHGTPSNRTPRVNNLTFAEGHYFTSYNESSVLVQLAFAKAQNVHLGDTILVEYGNIQVALTVIGIVFSPEYKYSVDPNGLPSPGSFAPLWIPLELAQAILGKGDVINEYFIRVNDYSLVNQTIADVKNYISNTLHLEVTATLGIDEMDHKTFEADVGFLDDYAYAFGLLLFTVAGFIIYDSITKIIMSEYQLIGIMRAMGAKKSTLVMHYFLYGLILGILGFLVSIPLNYLIIMSMVNFYLSFLGIILAQSITIAWAPLINATITVLILVSIFTLFASYRVTTIEPVEAIRGNIKVKPYRKTFIDTWLSKLFPKRKILVKIPLRGLTNNKRRTLITAFTLLLSLVLVIASFGMIDSMEYQINLYFTNNVKYQLEVTLSDPHDPTELIPQILTIDGINAVEGFVHQFASIENPNTNKNYTTALVAFSSNSSMRTFTFKEGGFKPGKIVIGQKLARELHVGIGDRIRVTTQSYGLLPFTISYYTISGITQELVDIEVYLELNDAQSLSRLGRNVTSLAIQATKNIDEIKDELLSRNLPVSSITDQQQLKTSILGMLEGLISIMMVVSIIAIIILILFTLNILVLEAMEREREFGNLRVSGANKLDVTLIIGLQILVLLVLVALFQKPLGYYVTEYINDQVILSFMYLKTYVSKVTFAISDITLIFGTIFGVISAIRYVMKLSLAVMTRTRFQT